MPELEEITDMLQDVEIQVRPGTTEARLPELPLASPWLNPTQLDRPAFLLSFPFSYSTRIANKSLDAGSAAAAPPP